MVESSSDVDILLLLLAIGCASWAVVATVWAVMRASDAKRWRRRQFAALVELDTVNKRMASLDRQIAALVEQRRTYREKVGEIEELFRSYLIGQSLLDAEEAAGHVRHALASDFGDLDGVGDLGQDGTRQ